MPAKTLFAIFTKVSWWRNPRIQNIVAIVVSQPINLASGLVNDERPCSSKTTGWPAWHILFTDANGFDTGAARINIPRVVPSRMTIGILMSPRLGIGSPVAEKKFSPFFDPTDSNTVHCLLSNVIGRYDVVARPAIHCDRNPPLSRRVFFDILTACAHIHVLGLRKHRHWLLRTTLFALGPSFLIFTGLSSSSSSSSKAMRLTSFSSSLSFNVANLLHVMAWCSSCWHSNFTNLTVLFLGFSKPLCLDLSWFLKDKRWWRSPSRSWARCWSTRSFSDRNPLEVLQHLQDIAASLSNH